MSWGALAGMALGAAQSYAATQSYIDQLGYETAGKVASITAAKEAYQADVDAFVVQNFINEELARNAIVEAERATGATVREAQVQVREAEGKIQAASEGITAGASFTTSYIEELNNYDKDTRVSSNINFSTMHR